ncbi:MAG: DUF3320 domain-containing protein [Clostridia bacterium]|nr:DUF3320 domain-containing protein [Clostridia bacterium]
MTKLESAILNWENSLLDLGKRNRMINYPIRTGSRSSQQTLRLEEPGYAEIYDLLVRQGKSLTVQQPPVEKFDLRCEAVMRLFERLGSPVVPMQGVLRPAGSFTEYRKVLKNMRSKMKLAREEQGIGILYLAVGFLDWKQLTGRMEELTSPLLLVPVRLKMKSIRAPYVLEMLDEDVVVNPALNQLFQMEYGLSLPELTDENAPVDEFLARVEELARGHSWAVRRECHLALMSFQKISMYHDLKRSHDRIGQSAVLRAIAGEDAYPMDASVMDGVSLDKIRPEDSHLVVNADSSQHYAVELSRRGVSFCLQGPPGGGKSQTITNIIAQALADGKKVLFVAEKMAALDVVHRRLQKAGLGEFTLALHSHRANRKAILAEIGRPLQLEKQTLDHHALSTLDALEDLRARLNVYPALLHRVREPFGDSLYTVLGELAELQALPLVHAPLSGVEDVSRSALTAELTRLGSLSRAHARYLSLESNPYEGLQGKWTTFMARTQLQNETKAVLEDTRRLQPDIARLRDEGLLPASGELTALAALTRICALVRRQGPVSAAWYDHAGRIAALAGEALEAAAAAENARQEAAQVLLPGVKLDANAFLTRFCALESDLQAVLTGTDWQLRTDAYATHYEQLAAYIPRLNEAAERALTLLGCTGRTGREADWAMDVLAALVAAPHIETLPDAEETRAQLAQIQSLQEQAARLNEQAAAVLGSSWKDSALAVDAAAMLHRMTPDPSFFAGLRNLASVYKELQTLAPHYNGVGHPTEKIALPFLNRLAAWQDAYHAWARPAYSLALELNLPFRGLETDWSDVQQHLTSLSALAELARDPGHRTLILNALQRADIRQQAAAIPNFSRYAAFDNSLRGAAFAGDALADDIGHTLRAILSAAEDLAALRAALDALRPACVPGATMPAILSALRAADTAARSQTLVEDALRQLSALLPEENVSAQAYFAAMQTRADALSAAEEAGKALPAGLVRRLLTGCQPLPQLPALPDLPDVAARLTAFAAHFTADASPLAMPFEAMCARLERCLAEPDALDLWQEWRDASAEMEGTLFSAFVPAAIAAAVPDEQWTDAARRLFLYTWVEHVLDAEPLLSVFRAHNHQESIARFDALDQQQLDIARSRIRKQLIDVVPDEKHRALSATDELAILLSEMNRKGGHMPLRKLFSKIPNLLTTLKPCMMMSPLSVASYLEDNALTFDLVIFDEASQIMPENAIGAIMRGRQVIVTGDTKQMPPTDFFTVSVGASDYDTDDEDEAEQERIPEESILEQCAAVLPSCPLLWHYRSRHESLIAFSNREIYAGRLVTFPGAVDKQPHLGVELEYVPDGVFHKRRNKQEARRCIQLIEDHILNRSHRSLGVVAFSRTQQAAIEEELHRFRIAHPEYDEFFDEHREEPFFIKNLENVQGDERDTMIFSVGYAKREGGKPMLLNLGPLSASGGERRLNVAITRARYNVKLVSSVLAGDIDLSRTASEGTRLLRAYIDYAGKGFAAIEADGAVTASARSDAFALHLAQVLEAAGYRVERAVGCSDCRIDVAVCHPTQEGRYVLGVMTDGAAYAAQQTCRDRDSLQASVLRGMGWRLHRVWSADWLQRPDGVERELLAAAADAISNPDPVPEQDAQPQRVWSRPADTADAPPAVAFPDYQPALLPEGETLPINELVLRVVETEQPVHRDELCRRLAPALGHDRVDPGLRREVEVSVARLKLDDLREEDGFLTREGFRLTQPRRAGHRSIDMIAPEELRLAIFLVVKHSLGATREGVITRVAELLGYERRGPRIQKALENAFDFLVAVGTIRMTADGKAEVLPEETPARLIAPESGAALALPAPEPPADPDDAPALSAPEGVIALPAPEHPQEVNDHD